MNAYISSSVQREYLGEGTPLVTDLVPASWFLNTAFSSPHRLFFGGLNHS